MTDIETTVQLEEAKASRGNIPTGLSFEEVIKNRPLPVSCLLAEEGEEEEEKKAPSSHKAMYSHVR